MNDIEPDNKEGRRQSQDNSIAFTNDNIIKSQIYIDKQQPLCPIFPAVEIKQAAHGEQYGQIPHLPVHIADSRNISVKIIGNSPVHPKHVYMERI